MSFVRKSMMASVALLAVAIVASPVAANGRPLKAEMTGANEFPGPGDLDGTGTARLRLNQGRHRICYSIEVSDIDPAGDRGAHPSGCPGRGQPARRDARRTRPHGRRHGLRDRRRALAHQGHPQAPRRLLRERPQRASSPMGPSGASSGNGHPGAKRPTDPRLTPSTFREGPSPRRGGPLFMSAA